MGHLEDECDNFKERETSSMETPEVHNFANGRITPKPTHKPEEQEEFGSWMLVKKPVRTKTTRIANPSIPATGQVQVGGPQTDQPIPRSPKKVETAIEPQIMKHGSRFSVLENQPINEITKEGNPQLIIPNLTSNLDTMVDGLEDLTPNVDLSDPITPIPNPQQFVLGKPTLKGNKISAKKILSKTIQEKKKKQISVTKKALTSIQHANNAKAIISPL